MTISFYWESVIQKIRREAELKCKMGLRNTELDCASLIQSSQTKAENECQEELQEARKSFDLLLDQNVQTVITDVQREYRHCLSHNKTSCDIDDTCLWDPSLSVRGERAFGLCLSAKLQE